MLGLFELVFVLGLAFAWGLYELWTLRRDRRKSSATPPPDPMGPSP